MTGCTYSKKAKTKKQTPHKDKDTLLYGHTAVSVELLMNF